MRVTGRLRADAAVRRGVCCCGGRRGCCATVRVRAQKAGEKEGAKDVPPDQQTVYNTKKLSQVGEVFPRPRT
jgi:hypothetical protein